MDVPLQDRSRRRLSARLSWIALATLAALAVSGCNRNAPPREADAATAGEADTREHDDLAHTAGAGTGEPATPPRANGDPARHFQGAARDTLLARALPAGALLSQDMQATATQAAELEGCRATHDPSSSLLIDLDADGQQEAIGFYTLNACRDGSGNMRILVVLRRTPAGGWVPVTQVALAIGAQPDRPVTGIDTERGIITLAGEPDGLGGTSPPQLIEIPPAERPGDGAPDP
ncbi:MAG: hypothetical protein KIS72_06125 [Luteimonas sp.]|nr:hypothetical protein [Luteimonas sp.]